MSDEDEDEVNWYGYEEEDEVNWHGCESVLTRIETAMRECRSYHERCRIYDDTVNVHRPWYWLQPESEFMEVSDAASEVFHCDALRFGPRIMPKTRNEKRQLLDAEKKFVQALHFNEHVRPNHVCELSYRHACYFGVDAVWCESNGTDSDEVDGSVVLYCLRHLFANPAYADKNDDTL